jgi:uncharacterized membrane protein YfcA
LESDLLIVVTALFVGLLVGLTGIGGGVIMTPFLILLDVRPIVAVGTSLVQMPITKLFGTWQHHQQGSVDWRLVFPLAIGSIPGALLGVGLLVVLDRQFNISVDDLISRLLGGILVLVALLLIFRHRLRSRADLSSKTSVLPELIRGRPYILPFLGFGIGLLVGLSSVGSGSILIAILSLLFRMSMPRLVGTDIAHSILVTGAAGAAHIGAGNVDFGLAGLILLGSIPGVILGSRLTIRVPENALRAAVSVMLLVVGLSLL